MEVNKVSTFQPTHFQTGISSSYNKAPQSIKHKKKNVKSEDKETEELDINERKQQNQRYMDVLRDLARLRDHYYSVYLNKLEAKVAKQHKEIAAREETIKKRLLKEEARKAKEAHKFKYRLPKNNFTTNTKYLQQIPKSRYYHLVAVEELMKSRGLLKHKFEVEEFWNKAKADHSFWVKPIPPSVSPDTLTEHMLSRYSSLTAHSKQDQSVISSTVLKNLAPLPGILKKAMDNSDEEETEEMRPETPPLVFPEQPKFPKLHSYNVNLGSVKSNASTITNLSQGKVASTSESSEHHRRKLHHHLTKDAYNIAVVNTAMSGRQLNRHGLELDELKPLSEITEIWCGESDAGSVSSSKIVKKKLKGKDKHKQAKFTKKAIEANVASFETLKTISEESTTPEAVAPQPLSMDMMLSSDQLQLKKVKGSSKLWTNYA